LQAADRHVTINTNDEISKLRGEFSFLAVDQVKGRPRVAIVGTGLSGAILAELLNPVCNLVLFERGNDRFERESDVKFTAHQPG
jgi:hypothetical protein